MSVIGLATYPSSISVCQSKRAFFLGILYVVGGLPYEVWKCRFTTISDGLSYHSKIQYTIHREAGDLVSVQAFMGGFSDYARATVCIHS